MSYKIHNEKLVSVFVVLFAFLCMIFYIKQLTSKNAYKNNTKIFSYRPTAYDDISEVIKDSN